jgi:peroxiredoxin
MPSLAKLYNEFQNKKFVVLAIDIQEKPEIVKRYVEQEKLPFPILMDFTGQVAFKYGWKGRAGCFGPGCQRLGQHRNP